MMENSKENLKQGISAHDQTYKSAIAAQSNSLAERSSISEEVTIAILRNPNNKESSNSSTSTSQLWERHTLSTGRFFPDDISGELARARLGSEDPEKSTTFASSFPEGSESGNWRITDDGSKSIKSDSTKLTRDDYEAKRSKYPPKKPARWEKQWNLVDTVWNEDFLHPGPITGKTHVFEPIKKIRHEISQIDTSDFYEGFHSGTEKQWQTIIATGGEAFNIPITRGWKLVPKGDADSKTNASEFPRNEKAKGVYSVLYDKDKLVDEKSHDKRMNKMILETHNPAFKDRLRAGPVKPRKRNAPRMIGSLLNDLGNSNTEVVTPQRRVPSGRFIPGPRFEETFNDSELRRGVGRVIINRENLNEPSGQQDPVFEGTYCLDSKSYAAQNREFKVQKLVLKDFVWTREVNNGLEGSLDSQQSNLLLKWEGPKSLLRVTCSYEGILDIEFKDITGVVYNPEIKMAIFEYQMPDSIHEAVLEFSNVSSEPKAWAVLQHCLYTVVEPGNAKCNSQPTEYFEEVIRRLTAPPIIPLPPVLPSSVVFSRPRSRQIRRQIASTASTARSTSQTADGKSQSPALRTPTSASTPIRAFSSVLSERGGNVRGASQTPTEDPSSICASSVLNERDDNAKDTSQTPAATQDEANKRQHSPSGDPLPPKQPLVESSRPSTSEFTPVPESNFDLEDAVNADAILHSDTPMSEVEDSEDIRIEEQEPVVQNGKKHRLSSPPAVSTPKAIKKVRINRNLLLTTRNPDGLWYQSKSDSRQLLPVGIMDLVVRLRAKEEMELNGKRDKTDIFDGPWHIVEFDSKIYSVDDDTIGAFIESDGTISANIPEGLTSEEFQKMLSTKVKLNFPKDTKAKTSWVPLSQLLPVIRADTITSGDLCADNSTTEQDSAFKLLKKRLAKPDPTASPKKKVSKVTDKEHDEVDVVEIRRGLYVGVTDIDWNSPESGSDGNYEVGKLRKKFLRLKKIGARATMGEKFVQDDEDNWTQMLIEQYPEVAEGHIVVAYYLTHWAGWTSEDDGWVIGHENIPESFIIDYNNKTDPFRIIPEGTKVYLEDLVDPDDLAALNKEAMNKGMQAIKGQGRSLEFTGADGMGENDSRFDSPSKQSSLGPSGKRGRGRPRKSDANDHMKFECPSKLSFSIGGLSRSGPGRGRPRKNTDVTMGGVGGSSSPSMIGRNNKGKSAAAPEEVELDDAESTGYAASNAGNTDDDGYDDEEMQRALQLSVEEWEKSQTQEKAMWISRGESLGSSSRRAEGSRDAENKKSSAERDRSGMFVDDNGEKTGGGGSNEMDDEDIQEAVDRAIEKQFRADGGGNAEVEEDDVGCKV